MIEPLDSLSDDAPPEIRRRALVATALNNLAWLEATCSDVSFRNAREAVRHARRATVLEPEEGNYWNTLGAAHYRAGEWEEAKAALTQLNGAAQGRRQLRLVLSVDRRAQAG